MDGDPDVKTLGIHEGIELGISDIYFGGCYHDNLESLMTLFQDGINGDVNGCVSGGLGKGFDGDLDIITLSIYRRIKLDFI